MGVTEQSVQSTIDAAWSKASSAQSAAESYASLAVSAASAFLNNYGQGYNLNVSDYTIDSSFSKTLSDISKETSNSLRDSIPDAYKSVIRDAIGTIKASSIYSGSGSGENAVEIVDGLASSFSSTFAFHNDINQMASFLTEGLISGNVPYGLPTEVEEQLRARTEDAVARQQSKAESDVYATYAARGFPLPPGAMSAKLSEIAQEGMAEKVKTIREVHIDQAKRGLEMTTIRIQAFGTLQQSVTSNFVDYLKAVISARSDMEDTVQTLTDAIVKLRGSVIASYSFAVQQRDQMLREAVAEGQLTMEQRRIDVENFKATAENTAKAAMAAAKTMGDLAAAAVGSQNTMATIAYETISQNSGG